MSSRPRRSRRAPKKFTDFTPGDVVELTRGGIPVRAHLMQLLTDKAPNRWLVRFCDDNDDETLQNQQEQVYEHAFGKKLISAASPSSPSSSKRGSTSSSSSDNSHQNHEDVAAATTSNTSSPVQGNMTILKTTNSSSNDDDDDDDEGSTSFPSGMDEAAREQARVSAREARSRRRQAKMIQESKLAKSRTAGFRSAMTTKSGKRTTREEGEDVVKISLLTGTLYLYHGPKKRRAEFVRRV